MSYSNLPILATGDWIDAAYGNQYWGDNFRALWPYTTAGDLAYATGASANLARLGISAIGGVLYSTGSAPAWLVKPTVESVLRHTGGSVPPSWAAPNLLKGSIHTSGFDNTTTEVDTTSTTGVDITGLTLNLTTTVTCTIMMWIHGSIAITGGSAIYTAGVIGHIGGVAQTIDNSIPRSFYAQYEPYGNIYRRTGVGAGIVTCKAQLFTQDASRTAHFFGGSIFAMAIVE